MQYLSKFKLFLLSPWPLDITTPKSQEWSLIRLFLYNLVHSTKCLHQEATTKIQINKLTLYFKEQEKEENVVHS